MQCQCLEGHTYICKVYKIAEQTQLTKILHQEGQDKEKKVNYWCSQIVGQTQLKQLVSVEQLECHLI